MFSEPKQPTTRIPKPRFGTKPATKVTKPVTPGNKNWAKIHAARMNKMESIDDYLERKRKRTETMCASVKRAKVRGLETTSHILRLMAIYSYHLLNNQLDHCILTRTWV